jgi:hypothetical protein
VLSSIRKQRLGVLPAAIAVSSFNLEPDRDGIALQFRQSPMKYGIPLQKRRVDISAHPSESPRMSAASLAPPAL